MAERSRRGGAADEFDDDAPDAVNDRADDRSDAGQRESGGEAVSRSRAATATRSRLGFGRVGRFLREVVAELRKVIWPTRKELVTYAVVVVVFIAVMMTIIAGFDYGFARAVQWVFGS